MPYIRLSIMKPRRGEEARVEELLRKLDQAVAAAPGCQVTYLMRPHDDSGEIARLAIYDSEEAAEHAANDTHIMALRSEIHLCVEPGHIERAFFTI
ncbi:MAG: antibiotic biosynthesis monooxygenase [Dehalococcoidia bacterium]|nr:antibiotic biosynthesis monooxygenase [Dehalococcoidia bacterium]